MCKITLQAPTLAGKCDDSHWFSCGAEERGCTYGHVTTEISWMERYQIFLAMGLHARGAPILSFYAAPGVAIPLHTFCKE